MRAFNDEDTFTETGLLVVEKMPNQRPVGASKRAEKSRHVRPSYHFATGSEKTPDRTLPPLPFGRGFRGANPLRSRLRALKQRKLPACAVLFRLQLLEL